MYIFQMIDVLSMGGAQQLLLTFSSEAKKRNAKLTIVCLDDDVNPAYIERFSELGVVTYIFPTRRIFDFNNLIKIARLFLIEKPDVLHTHLTYSNIIGSLIARLTGVPVVSTIHSTGVEPRFHAPRTEYVEKFVLRHLIHTVIACGPSVARYYRETIKEEPDLMIPNAVDFRAPKISDLERASLREQISGDSKRPIVVSVGRLAVQKGFDDLVDAFSILHKSYPDAFLAIAGDGDLYGELMQKIKRTGMSDHIRLLGIRNDVPHILAVCDMYVLASHWEGLPIGILEAMSAGLPVLATNVGDNAWALDTTGIIVPPKQPEVLAHAMGELLDDLPRRISLGKAAQRRIDEHFNPTPWADKLFSVYKDVARR